MSASDRVRWEQKHAGGARGAARSSVAHMLDEANVGSGGGLALDLACGRGRNADLLLQRGYRVIAADIARAALVTARRERTSVADRTDVSVIPVQMDVDEWPFREGAFDLVLQCDFLDRRLFPTLQRCVKPGGVLAIETFACAPPQNADGPNNPAFRLRPGELTSVFAGWQSLREERLDREGPRASIVVRRPTRERR